MSQALHPMLNIAIKAARAAGVDHQPGLARPRPAEGQHQGAERLRHRGRPRGRSGDHRDPARRLPGPRHPGRGIGPRARRARQRVRLDHRPARRHHQLHPRLSGLRGVDRARASAARSSRRSSTTRRATTCSTPRKGRGAFLNDRRLRVSKRTRMAECADRHRLSVPQGRQLQALPADVRGGDAELRRPAPARRRGARPVLRRRRLATTASSRPA